VFENLDPEFRMQQANRRSRIVVITNGNYFSRLLLEGLINEFREDVAIVLIITGDYNGRTGLAALGQLIRVTALPYLIYKVASIAVFSIAQRLRPSVPYVVEALARKNAIPVARFATVQCKGAIESVEAAQPDIIVSVSCPQLVPERILAAARCGGINIHGSLLPRFAGLAPYFWVLAEGESSTGITVHYMTKRFDEGNILGQHRVATEPSDSAFALFCRLARAGAPLLVSCLRRALAGDVGVSQSRSESRRFSHPKLRSYVRLRSRGHHLARFGEFWRAVFEST
jgi:methionyl-tRNA formyltransferase